MAATLTVPFFPTATLAVALLGALVTWRWLPSSWTWPTAVLAAIVGGSAIAGIGVACGLLSPWGQVVLAAHALFTALGFFFTWVLARRRAAPLGLDPERLRLLFVTAIMLGLIGARARYVMERWDRFMVDGEGHPVTLSQALLKAADLDAGGAVWYGGMLLASLGMVGWLVRWRVSLLGFFDLILPCGLVGLAIGRIGCFFNGCCYGAPTDLPWAVACPLPPHGPVHPTQLYETLACLLMAAALWWGYPRHAGSGRIFFFGVVGYGLWRFANEGLRGGHDAFAHLGPWTMTTSQATSLELIVAAWIVAGVVIWARRRQVPKVAGVELGQQKGSSADEGSSAGR